MTIKQLESLLVTAAKAAMDSRHNGEVNPNWRHGFHREKYDGKLLPTFSVLPQYMPKAIDLSRFIATIEEAGGEVADVKWYARHIESTILFDGKPVARAGFNLI